MKEGTPVYLLKPKNFWEHGLAKQWEVAFTSSAVKHVLAELHIRRGMLTPMTLPNGEIASSRISSFANSVNELLGSRFSCTFATIVACRASVPFSSGVSGNISTPLLSSLA